MRKQSGAKPVPAVPLGYQPSEPNHDYVGASYRYKGIETQWASDGRSSFATYMPTIINSQHHKVGIGDEII